MQREEDSRMLSTSKGNRNMNTNKAKYEILDSMEVKVAEADSFEDAMYAAEKYAPAMVVRVGSGKACYTTR